MTYLDNQPTNAGQGRPGALDGDPVNQTNTLADARGISDLSKNKGKHKDNAAYVNEETKELKENEKETIEEDFEPFNLDKIEDKEEE